MKVRIAEPSDIDRLVEFNQEMALETEAKILDEDCLRNGVAAVIADGNKGFYVVAENEKAIVAGLLVTREWSDWRNAWFWWIQSVYVLPSHRGRHIYELLYEYVKRQASAAGDVCGFRLYVEKENRRAQRVYERCGMSPSHYLMYEEN